MLAKLPFLSIGAKLLTKENYNKDMATKRFSIALISLFLIMSAFAANKDVEKDITMVSYEQGWLDSRGTLALKNNTNEEIHNVVFQIIYLDMSGNPLDYEDFTKKITIAPGMTKKLDVPAYEHSRNYHYYKSENMPGGSPSFKIKFQLNDYNVEEEENNIEEIDDYNLYNEYDYVVNKSDGSYFIIAILTILFAIGVSVGLYILVAVMAQKRNRSVVLWVFLSLLATPLLMIIILLVIGKNEEYY